MSPVRLRNFCPTFYINAWWCCSTPVLERQGANIDVLFYAWLCSADPGASFHNVVERPSGPAARDWCSRAVPGGCSRHCGPVCGVRTLHPSVLFGRPFSPGRGCVGRSLHYSLGLCEVCQSSQLFASTLSHFCAGIKPWLYDSLFAKLRFLCSDI
jgi:hypothetical protein